MEMWLTDRFLDGQLRLPGGLLQTALNFYVSAYHWYGVARGRGSGGPAPQPEQIAEHSRELMAAHYDMPLPLFERMLGPTMKYSMALWERGAPDLEAAQRAMLADVCDKAEIRDGDTVLDIGCGFGSLCHHILSTYPAAKVVGLTLSRTQADYIRRMQEQAGHPFSSSRFQLVQEDFNTARFDQSFDRVVSLGVFEHVSNLDRALEKLRAFLNRNGTLFLHYIVYRRPLHRITDQPEVATFIGRYIFPGGRIWFDEELPRHDTHFTLAKQWFLGGENYRRTINVWLERFLGSRDFLRSAAGMSDRALRLWEFYLRACIAVFSAHGGRFYGNGQYLLTPR